MFEQNGNCGYVRKPRVMWDKSHMMYGRFDPGEKSFDGFHTLNLSITVSMYLMNLLKKYYIRLYIMKF